MSPIISADSHVVEPFDLWADRIDKKYRADAPRLVTNDDGIDVFVGKNVGPYPVGSLGAGGQQGEEVSENMRRGAAAIRKGCWDPDERLVDQDVDAVSAEVLYPTLGMLMFRSDLDADVMMAYARLYNDWLAEFCAQHPDRLIGIALLPTFDVPAAATELERAAGLGLKGGMVWASPPDDSSYSSSEYDVLWQTASDGGLPISLHALTGRGKESRRARQDMARVAALYIHEVQRTFVDLIMGNVLERFPELKIVSAENDVGWIPNLLERLDHWYDKAGAQVVDLPPLRPSEYVGRQIFATFQDDRAGILLHELFGDDNYMWGSDFPHVDSTWPNSVKVIERDFADISPKVVEKMTHGNAVSLYKL